MSNTCPRPDTSNRYEGRGSGDRIARLKALATRQGPAPVQNTASWNLTKQQGCCQPNGVGYVTISNCSGSVTLADNIYTLVVTNAFSSAIEINIDTDNPSSLGTGNPLVVPVGGQTTYTGGYRIVSYDYQCNRGLAISACGQTDSFINAPYLVVDSLLNEPVTLTITERNGLTTRTSTIQIPGRSSEYIEATPGYTIIGTSVSCP